MLKALTDLRISEHQMAPKKPKPPTGYKTAGLFGIAQVEHDDSHEELPRAIERKRRAAERKAAETFLTLTLEKACSGDEEFTAMLHPLFLSTYENHIALP